MFVLVSGGASSGKSEYAESRVVAAAGEPRIYIATMEIWDDEGRARANKHLRMREGKGFDTVEKPRDLAALELPQGSDILLECLSNLAANECFGGLGFEGCADRIMLAVEKLVAGSRLLVAVTNEVFSDGCDYDPETSEYIRVLGELNRRAAAMADEVVEVVCGIPIFHKGGAL